MKVLIVEDNELLRTAMARVLLKWGAEVVEADTEEKAIEALGLGFDLLITDVKLSKKGSGVRVAEAAALMRPCPLIMAISGKATPLESFRLAQAGVATFIAKPLDFDQFVVSIEAIISNPPTINNHVTSEVGHRSYHDVLRGVRKTMIEQALAKSGGNRVQAAKLLDVSRQAVQQLIKDFDIHANDCVN